MSVLQGGGMLGGCWKGGGWGWGWDENLEAWSLFSCYCCSFVGSPCMAGLSEMRVRRKLRVH